MSGPAYTNTVRIGYARVSARTQDHQLQLDALDAAGCREVIVETASTRGQRPKLRVTLGRLKPGDTLVIYKPDRIARSMKESGTKWGRRSCPRSTPATSPGVGETTNSGTAGR